MMNSREKRESSSGWMQLITKKQWVQDSLKLKLTSTTD